MARKFANLDIDLVAFSARFQIKAQQLVQNAAAKSGKNVAFANPILTGFSSGNWQASVGQPKRQKLQRFFPNESSAEMNWLRMQKPTPGLSVYVSNAVHYIWLLDKGFSPKQPVVGWINREALRGVTEEVNLFNTTGGFGPLVVRK